MGCLKPNSRIFEQLLRFWIIHSLDLIIVNEILLSACMCIYLESMAVQGVTRRCQRKERASVCLIPGSLLLISGNVVYNNILSYMRTCMTVRCNTADTLRGKLALLRWRLHEARSKLTDICFGFPEDMSLAWCRIQHENHDCLPYI